MAFHKFAVGDLFCFKPRTYPFNTVYVITSCREYTYRFHLIRHKGNEFSYDRKDFHRHATKLNGFLLATFGLYNEV